MGRPWNDAISYDVHPDVGWEQARAELKTMEGLEVLVEFTDTRCGWTAGGFRTILKPPTVLYEGPQEMLVYEFEGSDIAIPRNNVTRMELTVGYVCFDLDGLRVRVNRWSERPEWVAERWRELERRVEAEEKRELEAAG